jgi:hypothetical protein
MSFSRKHFLEEASSLKNKFPRKLGSIILRKLGNVFLRKLGSVFSRKLGSDFPGKRKMFSQGNVIIKEYASWRSVILGKLFP